MNYRHAFHAGNFADVFKHVLLSRMLVYLMRKDTPLRYMDTHAGIGAYELTGEEASRTLEWQSGIARVLEAKPPQPIADLLEPWLASIGPIKDGALYPGSPLLAARLLRPQDRMALNELHPEDSASLRRVMNRETRRDERLRFTSLDAYAALNAWCPPPERRGLALIDPAFEAPDEFQSMTKGVIRAWRKWRTGIFALWYPLKDREAVQQLYAALAAEQAGPILRLEIGVDEVAAQGRLTACGLAVVNPPYGLEIESATLLPWLTERMAVGEGRFFVCQFN